MKNPIVFDNDMTGAGDQQHLIRVNGRRSVGAYGRTKEEAYQNALKVAAETWQHHSYIFALLAPEAV